MNQITILNQTRVPMGPFTREQVANKLQRGEVTLNSLAHAEGFSEWTPLRDVLRRIDAALPRVPVATLGGTPVSLAPAYSYAATMAPPPHLRFAGFWLRLAAFLIDTLIWGLVSGVLSLLFILAFAVFGGAASIFAAALPADSTGPAAGLGLSLMIIFLYLGFVVLLFVSMWLYYAKQESGPHQATLGKRAMGLRVTDMAGGRISFGRASGRFFAKIVSRMIFYIGYIMAAFTERKQALHDLIADTLVVQD